MGTNPNTYMSSLRLALKASISETVPISNSPIRKKVKPKLPKSPSDSLVKRKRDGSFDEGSNREDASHSLNLKLNKPKKSRDNKSSIASDSVRDSGEESFSEIESNDIVSSKQNIERNDFFPSMRSETPSEIVSNVHKSVLECEDNNSSKSEVTTDMVVVEQITEIKETEVDKIVILTNQVESEYSFAKPTKRNLKINSNKNKQIKQTTSLSKAVDGGVSDADSESSSSKGIPRSSKKSPSKPSSPGQKDLSTTVSALFSSSSSSEDEQEVKTQMGGAKRGAVGGGGRDASRGDANDANA